MNIVRDDLPLRTLHIVEPCEVHPLHDVRPELHEGLDITDITVYKAKAEDNSNTKENEMSDQNSLTGTESYKQLESPPPGSPVFKRRFEKIEIQAFLQKIKILPVFPTFADQLLKCSIHDSCLTLTVTR